MQNIGPYKVEDELGRGGMGVVYKAYDESLNRHVAIKMLSEALARDESVVERFKREAKSMAALNDARIIQVYFIGETEEQPYFVMEFVPGESLSERLKRNGRLSVEEARRILRETAEGLDVAHRSGLIHRDIKPGNLMLTEAGNVKIADFGIARVQDLSQRLTNTGEFVGTPGYLSPEVCIGQEVDHRSDIFALGIVFYEMLTGDIPFTDVSPLGMMLEVVKADIPDVRSVRSEVDQQTGDILNRMIAKDPEQRYQSCAELVADLRSTKPVGQRRSSEPTSKFNVAATQAIKELESVPGLQSGAAAQTVVSSPNQQMPESANNVDEPASQSSSKASGAGWVMAALLLVVVGAGASMYAFKDTLFGGSEEPEQISMARTEMPPEDSTTEAKPESEADEISDAELQAELQLWSAQRRKEEERQASAETRNETVANTVSRQNDSSSGTQNGVGTKLAMAANDREGRSEAARNANADDNKSSDDSRAVEPARDSTVTLAKAEPDSTKEPARIETKPQPPQPRAKGIVVIAVGDPAIAGPVEQMLEGQLIDNGYDLLDEAFFSGIGRVANAQGADLAALSDLLRRNGAEVLVLAQVDIVGETGLQYYGNYSTLYTANLNVRNILLSERRPLGRGWQKKVEFTDLNAAEMAQQAVDPILRDFERSLQDYKG